MTKKEIENLLIWLSRLSQCDITITSGCGKLKISPEEPEDPECKEYLKVVKPFLESLLQTGKLFRIIVNKTEVNLNFQDEDIHQQFTEVAVEKLGPDCNCEKPGYGNGWVAFDPKDLLKKLDL